MKIEEFHTRVTLLTVLTYHGELGPAPTMHTMWLPMIFETLFTMTFSIPLCAISIAILLIPWIDRSMIMTWKTIKVPIVCNAMRRTKECKHQGASKHPKPPKNCGTPTTLIDHKKPAFHDFSHKSRPITGKSFRFYKVKKWSRLSCFVRCSNVATEPSKHLSGNDQVVSC